LNRTIGEISKLGTDLPSGEDSHSHGNCPIEIDGGLPSYKMVIFHGELQL
jgi:hypothetical protein